MGLPKMVIRQPVPHRIDVALQNGQVGVLVVPGRGPGRLGRPAAGHPPRKGRRSEALEDRGGTPWPPGPVELLQLLERELIVVRTRGRRRHLPRHAGRIAVVWRSMNVRVVGQKRG